MATILLSFVLLGLVLTAMAVGVILKGKPIKGSCGGIGAMGMGRACEICGGDTQKCDTKNTTTEPGEKQATADLAYDASKR